jgi:hypothetical protein
LTYQRIRSFPIVAEFGEPFCPPYIVDNSISYETDILLREDLASRRVFIQYDEESGEEILYDFNLEVGDTIQGSYVTLGVTITVESIETVTLLSGADRKKFNLIPEGYYIESVGGYGGLQFHLGNTVNFDYIAECMYEDGENIWNGSGSSNNCFGVLSSEGSSEPEINLSVFPNPTSDYLMIDGLENESFNSYSVFDMEGREISKQSFFRWGQAIDISQLPKGVYILKLTNDAGKSVQKKFVKGE